MLGHAPPPLTANDLDMRDGHPAEQDTAKGSQARFSRLGALDEAQDEHRSRAAKCKGAVPVKSAMIEEENVRPAKDDGTAVQGDNAALSRSRAKLICAFACRALGRELEAIAALALRTVQCLVGPAERVPEVG